MAIFYTIEMAFLCWLFFKTIITFDKDHGLHFDKGVRPAVCLLSLAGAAVVSWHKMSVIPGALASVMFAYLITAGICDQQTKQVHDFLHVVCAAMGTILLAYNRPGWEVVWDYMIFLAIQVLFFQRMYGKADVAAFLVCSLYQAAFHKTMMTYLLHMGATYILLAAIQLWKGNVNRKGNLREPVALIPYIAVTAWMFI